MKPKYTNDRGAFLVWWRSYRIKAKRHGIPFKLSQSEFRDLVESQCYYCGRNPTQVTWNRARTIRHVHNGIDRVDNDRGYVRGNVVPCCRWCNYAKNNMTQPEFRRLVISIYQHWIAGND